MIRYRCIASGRAVTLAWAAASSVSVFVAVSLAVFASGCSSSDDDTSQGVENAAVTSAVTLRTDDYDHTIVLRNFVRGKGGQIDNLACGELHFKDAARTPERSCWIGATFAANDDGLREFELYPLEMHVYRYGAPTSIPAAPASNVDHVEDARIVAQVSCSTTSCSLRGSVRYPLSRKPIFDEIATAARIARLNDSYFFQAANEYRDGAELARLFLYGDAAAESTLDLGAIECTDGRPQVCRLPKIGYRQPRGPATDSHGGQFLSRLKENHPYLDYVGCDAKSCYVVECSNPRTLDPAAPGFRLGCDIPTASRP